ncbi:unnamed protein product [Caenorhabditis auriculariae]|uniref:Uncharacterized protein n=1 Tax=Caenorhabditis auriculariae TaxID=2777116 RepID=A0A8S1HDM1_9PELO|nr:unnamed protein product [Caenorhabditis auriculariae]
MPTVGGLAADQKKVNELEAYVVMGRCVPNFGKSPKLNNEKPRSSTLWPIRLASDAKDDQLGTTWLM